MFKIPRRLYPALVRRLNCGLKRSWIFSLSLVVVVVVLDALEVDLEGLRDVPERSNQFWAAECWGGSRKGKGREGEGTHTTAFGAASRLVLADGEENGVVRVCYARDCSVRIARKGLLSLSSAAWR